MSILEDMKFLADAANQLLDDAPRKGEVYHVKGVPVSICPHCKIMVEHQRVIAPEIDGYACCVCDTLSINDYTHFDTMGDRV